MKNKNNKENNMENEKKWPVVDPEGFCKYFDRCDTSLIEEPETCDVCNHYCDRDSTCRCEEK